MNNLDMNNRAQKHKKAQPGWRYASLAALFWLLLWALAARTVGQELLLPSPRQTLRALAALLPTGTFWTTVSASLLRTVWAFGLGTLLGALLAAVTHAWRWADALLRPALRVIRATPVPSFIILALVWMRGGGVPVLVGTLMVLPIVWGNVAQGLRDTDPRLLEVAAMYHFSPGQRLRHLFVPSVAPAFLAACETAMGLCWKACIAAEVIGTPALAIGTQLYGAKIYLETETLFAWTAVVIALSVLLERAFDRAMRALGARLGERGRAA